MRFIILNNSLYIYDIDSRSIYWSDDRELYINIINNVKWNVLYPPFDVVVFLKVKREV